MPVVRDYEEILAVIEQYADGHKFGSDLMKKSFHRNAIINAEPIQVLYEAIDEAGVCEPVTRVDILDIACSIACARVTIEECYGKNYIDFLQLMKTDDGWKIVSKIYQEF